MGRQVKEDPETVADLASRLRMHQAVADLCQLKIENIRGVNEMQKDHY